MKNRRQILWGTYGTNASDAKKMIGTLWDRGFNTDFIAKHLRIPECRVDRAVTDHVTAKHFRKTPF